MNGPNLITRDVESIENGYRRVFDILQKNLEELTVAYEGLTEIVMEKSDERSTQVLNDINKDLVSKISGDNAEIQNIIFPKIESSRNNIKNQLSSDTMPSPGRKNFVEKREYFQSKINDLTNINAIANKQRDVHHSENSHLTTNTPVQIAVENRLFSKPSVTIPKITNFNKVERISHTQFLHTQFPQTARYATAMPPTSRQTPAPLTARYTSTILTRQKISPLGITFPKARNSGEFNIFQNKLEEIRRQINPNFIHQEVCLFPTHFNLGIRPLTARQNRPQILGAIKQLGISQGKISPSVSHVSTQPGNVPISRLHTHSIPLHHTQVQCAPSTRQPVQYAQNTMQPVHYAPVSMQPVQCAPSTIQPVQCTQNTMQPVSDIRWSFNQLGHITIPSNQAPTLLSLATRSSDRTPRHHEAPSY